MRKAVLKRMADVFEKPAIGSMLVGLFQKENLGITIGLTCIAICFAVTIWEAKR